MPLLSVPLFSTCSLNNAPRVSSSIGLRDEPSPSVFRPRTGGDRDGRSAVALRSRSLECCTPLEAPAAWCRRGGVRPLRGSGVLCCVGAAAPRGDPAKLQSAIAAGGEGSAAQGDYVDRRVGFSPPVVKGSGLNGSSTLWRTLGAAVMAWRRQCVTVRAHAHAQHSSFG